MSLPCRAGNPLRGVLRQKKIFEVPKLLSDRSFGRIQQQRLGGIRQHGSVKKTGGVRKAGLATVAVARHVEDVPTEESVVDSRQLDGARKPLTAEQQKFLDSALRVNQAGELAAVLIYASQTPPLLRRHPHLKSIMKHMYDQEAGHFATFNALLAKHRIRPTAMYPVWTAAAKLLGWGTAVMGREAAMACTEAVETEIGGHYNGQIRVLLEWADKAKSEGRDLGEEFEGLVETLRRIRDEELEHLDTAVGHDAKMARPYEVLNGVIRAGCRGAIWITERI